MAAPRTPSPMDADFADQAADTVIKVVDMGFFTVLARQFDPVLDWPLFADAYRFVKDSFGLPGAIAAVAGAILLAVAVVVLMTLVVRRLAAELGAHPVAGRRGVLVASVAWVLASSMSSRMLRTRSR